MSINNILLTGGRAPVTLSLSRLLHANGYTVFIADAVGTHICKVSNSVKKSFLLTSPNEDRTKFINDLIKIVENNEIALIIPTCEEIFHIAIEKKRLEQYCRVFCEDIEILRELHSKWAFVHSFKGINGILKPETILVSQIEDIATVEDYLVTTQNSVVLKPVFSRFGSEVKIVSKGDSFDKKMASIRADVQNGKEWVVQRYIEGSQACSYSIVQNGVVQAYSCYKTIYSVGAGATIHFEPYKSQVIHDFVHDYVSRNSFTGQIAFDFMLDKGGHVYPIECNPRATSGLCMFSEDSGIHKAFMENTNNIIFGHQNRMLFFPMLYVLLLTTKLTDVKKLIKAQDLIFSKKDMKPFFYQLKAFSYFYFKGKKLGITAIQATTIDIEWGGDQ